MVWFLVSGCVATEKPNLDVNATKLIDGLSCLPWTDVLGENRPCRAEQQNQVQGSRTDSLAVAGHGKLPLRGDTRDPPVISNKTSWRTTEKRYANKALDPITLALHSAATSILPDERKDWSALRMAGPKRSQHSTVSGVMAKIETKNTADQT